MSGDKIAISVTFDEGRGYVGHVPDLADVSADVFASAKPETMKRTLRRVHRSKEASSLGCVIPHWTTPAIKLICHWIVGTTVETIIRRWCCHVGGNNFITLR
jgi:hypothetical protein